MQQQKKKRLRGVCVFKYLSGVLPCGCEPDNMSSQNVEVSNTLLLEIAMMWWYMYAW